jgi:glycosylphosphatidylinositol transamidase (GPIT) subunit GPI8
LSVVKAIADFFAVRATYFFEEGTRNSVPPTDVLNELRKDTLSTQIGLRSTLLDKDGKKIILKLIDYILTLSGK